ncbi:MAG: ACT domain-containing protein [Marinoscillum sp.]
MTINTEGGIFEGEIELYVSDTQHVDQLIKNLERVQGVVSVTRDS